MSEATAKKNTAEVLRDAAQRVRRGWVQYISHDASGRGVCALGAMNDVKECGWLSDMPSWWECVNAVCRAISSDSIAKWNDAKGQTAENVAQGLEYAALLWEQEQAQKASESSAVGPGASPRIGRTTEAVISRAETTAVRCG